MVPTFHTTLPSHPWFTFLSHIHTLPWTVAFTQPGHSSLQDLFTQFTHSLPPSFTFHTITHTLHIHTFLLVLTHGYTFPSSSHPLDLMDSSLPRITVSPFLPSSSSSTCPSPCWPCPMVPCPLLGALGPHPYTHMHSHTYMDLPTISSLAPWFWLDRSLHHTFLWFTQDLHTLYNLFTTYTHTPTQFFLCSIYLWFGFRFGRLHYTPYIPHWFFYPTSFVQFRWMDILVPVRSWLPFPSDYIHGWPHTHLHMPPGQDLPHCTPYHLWLLLVPGTVHRTTCTHHYYIEHGRFIPPHHHTLLVLHTQFFFTLHAYISFFLPPVHTPFSFVQPPPHTLHTTLLPTTHLYIPLGLATQDWTWLYTAHMACRTLVHSTHGSRPLVLCTGLHILVHIYLPHHTHTVWFSLQLGLHLATHLHMSSSIVSLVGSTHTQFHTMVTLWLLYYAGSWFPLRFTYTPWFCTPSLDSMPHTVPHTYLHLVPALGRFGLVDMVHTWILPTCLHLPPTHLC